MAVRQFFEAQKLSGFGAPSVLKTEAQTALSSYREDFPLFEESDVVYLDSAASTQKPQIVIDTLRDFYAHHYANVHRGIYHLSSEATEYYESSRKKVQKFLNARSEREIIFTRGTTESINLVAKTFGTSQISSEDEIIISIAEHHSNFVPWQLLAKETGAKIHYIGLTEEGEFDFEGFCSALSEKTKLVALTYVANGLGIELPVRRIVEEAHAAGAIVLIDGAQAVAHDSVDVLSLDVDFFAFSGHKLYGPTGIGVLYGKEVLLEQMPPFQSGGDMIRSVSVQGTTFNELPLRFEAGTPNIAGAIGLGAAIDYVSKIGLSNIATHESALMHALGQALGSIDGVEILGPSGRHKALISFVSEGVHPHDLAQFLDKENIAVRAGHHCAQPLLEWFGLSASSRVSVGIYNTLSDIHCLKEAIEKTFKFFRR